MTQHLQKRWKGCVTTPANTYRQKSSPQIGPRSTAAGAYHPTRHGQTSCATSCNSATRDEEAFARSGDDNDERRNDENTTPAEAEHQQQLEPATPALHAESAMTGVLTRPQENNKRAVERTVQRLHRNLGRPSNKEFVKLLTQRKASDSIIQAARGCRCYLCESQRF